MSGSVEEGNLRPNLGMVASFVTLHGGADMEHVERRVVLEQQTKWEAIAQATTLG